MKIINKTTQRQTYKKNTNKQINKQTNKNIKKNNTKKKMFSYLSRIPCLIRNFSISLKITVSLSEPSISDIFSVPSNPIASSGKLPFLSNFRNKTEKIKYSLKKQWK